MCLKVSPFQAYFNALLSTAATVAAAAGASTEQTNKQTRNMFEDRCFERILITRQLVGQSKLIIARS